ncbi:hypothetical protein BDR04DRAFT_1154889 [Suillus decipiens]|nr:hypothetical protein BDR04DRAFT_1154889 [Suillus decipiens]
MSLTAPTNPKRPQSLTVSPSTRHPKKKKEDHAKIVTGSTTLIGTLAKQASIKSRHVLRHEVDPRDNSNEASDALLNIAKRTVKIVNPLTGLFKPKEGTGNSRPSTPPASATSMSASSSTAELITHMASATINDAINNVTVPPTSKGNQTFIQLLSNSLVSAKDASACASALPHTTINLSSADPNATKEAHGRATAKSLCAIDWVASNAGGTNAAFESYWRKLDKDGKKKYQDKLALARTAKACAVVSPSISDGEVGRAAVDVNATLDCVQAVSSA